MSSCDGGLFIGIVRFKVSANWRMASAFALTHRRQRENECHHFCFVLLEQAGKKFDLPHCEAAEPGKNIIK